MGKKLDLKSIQPDDRKVIKTKINKKMFRSGSKSIPVIFATGLPLYLKDHDKVTETKTAQDFYLRKTDNETGKDRLYRMFSLE